MGQGPGQSDGQPTIAMDGERPGIALVRVIVGVVLAMLVTVVIGEGLLLGDELLARIERVWGRGARERVQQWQKLVAVDAGSEEFRKLSSVNTFFNSLPNVDDRLQWGQDDYWATPIELLAANGGDCEDFAIAKYFTLRAMGIPESRLRMIYVKLFLRESARIEAHMVLAYYASEGAEPMILDNRDPELRLASARSDLTPTYAFNADGLWLAKERGRGRKVDGASRISAWTQLLGRMQQEVVALPMAPRGARP